MNLLLLTTAIISYACAKMIPGKNELVAFFYKTPETQYKFEHSVLYLKTDGEIGLHMRLFPEFTNDLLRIGVIKENSLEYIFNSTENQPQTRIYSGKNDFIKEKKFAEEFKSFNIKRLLLQDEESREKFGILGSLCIKKNVDEVLCFVGKNNEIFVPVARFIRGGYFSYYKLEKSGNSYIIDLKNGIMASVSESSAFEDLHLPKKQFTKSIYVSDIKFKTKEGNIFDAYTVYYNVFDVSTLEIIREYVWFFLVLLLIISAVIFYIPVSAYFFIGLAGVIFIYKIYRQNS